MGTVRKTLFRLGPALAGLVLTGGALYQAGPGKVRAEDSPVKNASDFSSVEYYDPPNQMQIKSRLAGAEAIPQPDGRVLIRQLKLETFGTNGQPEYVVEAPECLYDQFKNTANSAGPLVVRQADGRVRLEGVGFGWLGNDDLLVISNQVRTEIETGPKIKIMP
jgi:hypothetical protein